MPSTIKKKKKRKRKGDSASSATPSKTPKKTLPPLVQATPAQPKKKPPPSAGIRRKVFLRWINHYADAAVTSPKTLSNGVVLWKLLKAFSEENLDKVRQFVKDPSNLDHFTTNLNLLFKHMERAKVNLVGVKMDQITRGTVSAIELLTWRCCLAFTISPVIHTASIDLKEVCRFFTQKAREVGGPLLSQREFPNDFRDGTALAHMLFGKFPEETVASIPPDDMDLSHVRPRLELIGRPLQPLADGTPVVLSVAMSLAGRLLGVPPLLLPGEVKDADARALAPYFVCVLKKLSQFPDVPLIARPPTPRDEYKDLAEMQSIKIQELTEAKLAMSYELNGYKSSSIRLEAEVDVLTKEKIAFSEGVHTGLDEVAALKEQNIRLEADLRQVMARIKEERVQLERLAPVTTVTTPVPKGVMAFLAEEVEGLFHLWELNPSLTIEALHIHDETVRSVLDKYGGYQIASMKDATVAAFQTLEIAVEASMEIQTRLLEAPWPPGLEALLEEMYSGDAGPSGGPQVASDPAKTQVESDTNSKTQVESDSDATPTASMVPPVLSGEFSENEPGAPLSVIVEETIVEDSDSEEPPTEARIWRGLRPCVAVHCGSPLVRVDSRGATQFHGSVVDQTVLVAAYTRGGQVVFSGRAWTATESRVRRWARARRPVTKLLGSYSLLGQRTSIKLYQSLPKPLARRQFSPVPTTGEVSKLLGIRAVLRLSVRTKIRKQQFEEAKGMNNEFSSAVAAMTADLVSLSKRANAVGSKMRTIQAQMSRSNAEKNMASGIAEALDLKNDIIALEASVKHVHDRESSVKNVLARLRNDVNHELEYLTIVAGNEPPEKWTDLITALKGDVFEQDKEIQSLTAERDFLLSDLKRFVRVESYDRCFYRVPEHRPVSASADTQETTPLTKRSRGRPQTAPAARSRMYTPKGYRSRTSRPRSAFAPPEHRTPASSTASQPQATPSSPNDLQREESWAEPRAHTAPTTLDFRDAEVIEEV